MVTNAVKDRKLYNLIWDDFAEYLLENTRYEVYFISSGKPAIKVTKENFKHFKELSKVETGYWNNQFIAVFELPRLNIEIEEGENHIVKVSSYNGFRGLWDLESQETWIHREADKRYIETTKPLQEARNRGENPVWNVDVEKIYSDIREEIRIHSGEL